MKTANNHIGEIYGIYKITGVLKNRDKYGHLLYQFTCTKCGHVRTAPYSQLKREAPQICTHVVVYEKKYCLHCGKEIPIATNNLSHHNKKKFYSQSCAASYNNKGVCRNPNKDPMTNKCLCCEKQIRRNQKYCSVSCQHEYEYKEYIRKWKSGEVSGLIGDNWIELSAHIRRYLFEKYNYQCSKCGWSKINPYTGKLPLEVEHIDGNAINCKEENLIVLCPNCHSLTPTYRGANKGNGKRDIKWVARKGSTNVSKDD